MINLVFDTKESIICEEHLYLIMFGLQDALEFYKKELTTYKKEDYYNITQYWYFKRRMENRIYETKKLLDEINSAIDKLE